MNVVCCSRDWCCKGLNGNEHAHGRVTALSRVPIHLFVSVVRVTDESISRYAGTILLRMLRKIDHIW